MLKPLPNPEDGTVIVGMSGGVDSAVAALLLRDAGYSVQGLFMSNWEDDDGYCTTASDFQDARRVCETLGIALHRVSFAEQYRERVFSHFLREYAAGRTPNPDVLCNREIKFGVCLDYMHRLGAGRIATGHYARLRRTEHGTELLKAVDESKDQSYFLHSVDPAALGRTLFPLGELRKDEVRRRAHAAGLSVHDKPDSTGICFIGERPFREFLARYLPRNPGPIRSAEGEPLGTHEGLAFYTLGQRAGLGIGGRAGRPAQPWYVAAKDPASNTLTVAQGGEHPLLAGAGLVSASWHWLTTPRHAPFAAHLKVRYRQADQPARLTPRADGGMQVAFEQPQRAITPGQYAVAYEAERCLGGGVIDTVSAALPRCAAA